MPNTPSTALIRVVALVPAVMLFVAMFQMPYGYYTLLRLVVTVAAAILVWDAISNSVRPLWAAVMALTILLFNPLVPVYLTRELWFFIDLVVAAVFVGYAFALKKNGQKE